MIHYEVNQLSGRKIPLAKWEKWFQAIAREIKSAKNLEVSVAVVGDMAIKKLNKVYRGKDEITDVLSFDEMSSAIEKHFAAKDFLGEIVICYQQAKRQAKKARHSLDDEMQLLLTHGFLHLLGYDHEIKKEAQKMRLLEEKIVGQSMIV